VVFKSGAGRVRPEVSSASIDLQVLLNRQDHDPLLPSESRLTPSLIDDNRTVVLSRLSRGRHSIKRFSLYLSSLDLHTAGTSPVSGLSSR
jgi:hypothetical protein